MSDERSERAIRKMVKTWNDMIDVHAEYYAGDATAEDVVKSLTAYLASVSTRKIVSQYDE